MSALRQAAQQALEALENTSPLGSSMESDKKFFAAITALRAALAEPVQSAEHWKHVANLWVDPETQDYVVDRCEHPLSELIPVYTAPPKALRLADLLEPCCLTIGDAQQAVAAAELRRLHAQRDALLEALKTVEWHGGGSCWVVDADKIAAAIKAAEENA